MKSGVLATMATMAVMGATLLAGCGTPAATNTSAHGSKINILETGSTLLFPLFSKWVPSYESSHHNVSITPAGTGSGTGIAQALAGSVQIGASDAYMSSSQMKPGILNIPLAISAQVVAYNLPGLNGRHLNLSGRILAGIYTGHITSWDDPEIAAANPGVVLPHHAIIPIRRSDASGDSFLFTSYLTDTAPTLWNAGFSTSPNWPAVSGEVSEDGNGGMVDGLKANPYSLAYVGISYLNSMESDNLGYAALQDKSGQYVLPLASNITRAASAMVSHTPADERVSLIDAPGSDAYPIINYEYAIVQSHQTSGSTAAALKTFMRWAISSSGGSAPAFLKTVHFLPLPASVVRLSLNQIHAIH